VKVFKREMFMRRNKDRKKRRGSKDCNVLNINELENTIKPLKA
jgi:hypothetical protein